MIESPIEKPKQVDVPGRPDSSSPQPQEGDRQFRLRLIILALVMIPFIGLIAAIVLSWGPAFSWLYPVILGGMYLLTTLGISVGYHRLFTHRSFETPRPVAAILAALGSMAVEGPLLNWVADHRRHHQHSDEAGDPHSPNMHGNEWWNILRGVWHAHVGWLFRSSSDASDRYVGDLRRDKLMRRMHRLFPLWVAVGLLIPAVIGGLVTMSWIGVLLGFIWGGLVRVFLVHHVTWSINSICHMWGTRPYRTHDESRNNAILGVLALGEGWHNNHHAFPNSARHGLRWWQIDVSYMIIRAMSLIGLARNIRIPAMERMIAKRG